MNRLERRLRILRDKRLGSFDPEQHFLESALRGRTARRVRANLRRMEPVILLTPRWSRSQTFLEDLAMDLAVNTPPVGCRTVSFRPLKGKGETDAWVYCLAVLAQLSVDRWTEARAPLVVSRLGFRSAAVELLLRAQDRPGARVALLGHAAEHLPFETLLDLSTAWHDFSALQPQGRRTTLLLAATVDAPHIQLGDARRIMLDDLGEAEAAATLVARVGLASPMRLETAARFTGGVPDIVDRLGTGARELGQLPSSASGMVRALGPLADEIRCAVDIASADPIVAERLDMFLEGEALDEEAAVDRTLVMAGLLRRTSVAGTPKIVLRAPAIGDMIR
jgi:hypothetical protein